MMSGRDVSSGPNCMGAKPYGGRGRREIEFFVEEGVVWSVVSAGLLRRMHTAVLVHLNVHVCTAPRIQTYP